MKGKKKLCAILALACALTIPTAALTACGGGTEDEKPPIVTPAGEISLDRKSVELDLHEEVQLVATCTDPSLALNWSSSDSTVATVDNNGLVKSVKAGTATITVTAGDYSATCSVKVVNSMTAPTLKLDAVDGKVFVNKDDEITVTAQVLYKGKPVNEAVELGWTLADGAAENVVSITPSQDTLSAVIRGLEYSETRIQVSALVWGTPLTAFVDVKVCNRDITFQVEDADPAEGGFSTRLATLAAGDHVSEKQLAVTVMNKDQAVPDAEIAWESSNPTVATVSQDGTITALKAGSTTVVGTYENNEVKIFVEVYLPEFELTGALEIETKVSTAFVLDQSVVGTPEKVLFAGVDALDTYDSATMTVTLDSEKLPTASADMGNTTVSVQTDKAIYNYINAAVYSKVIRTKDDLANLENWLTKTTSGGGTVWDGYVILGNDIDFEGATFRSFISWATLQQLEGTVNGFMGVFDGKGHVIDNLKSDGAPAGGFIGMVGKTGVVQNVAFTNAVHMGRSGFVCSTGAGTVRNVYVSYNEMHQGAIPDRSGTFFVRDNQGTSRIINCFVEVKKTVGNTDETYAIGSKHEMVGTAHSVYAVGLAHANGFHIISDAVWDVESEHFGAYATYADLLAANIDFSEWDTDFWKVVDGIPYPKSIEVSPLERENLSATVSATNTASGAAVDLAGKEIVFTGLMARYTATVSAEGAITVENMVKGEYDVTVNEKGFNALKVTFDGTALNLAFTERKSTLNATVMASIGLTAVNDIAGKELTFTAEGIEPFTATVGENGAITAQDVIYATYSVAIDDERFGAVTVTFEGNAVYIYFGKTEGTPVSAPDSNPDDRHYMGTFTVPEGGDIHTVSFGGKKYNGVVSSNTYDTLKLTANFSKRYNSYGARMGIELVFDDGKGVILAFDVDVDISTWTTLWTNPRFGFSPDFYDGQLLAINGLIAGEGTLTNCNPLPKAWGDKFLSDTGLNVSVVRNKNVLVILIEETVVGTYRLPAEYADDQIKFAFGGNDGMYNIPFKAETDLAAVEGITATTTGTVENGTVALEKTDYILGDEIWLAVTPAADYAVRSVTVNGTEYLSDKLVNGKLLLGIATQAVNFEISANFVEYREYDVTVTADPKWGADGLVITFEKDGITKTATLGDATASVVKGMANGAWDVSTVIAGLKMPLGKVSINDETCVIDFTSVFGDTIVGGELGKGKFTYATGYNKTIDFELATPVTGSAFFAAKIKLDAATVQAGQDWTCFSVDIVVNGVKKATPFMYNSSNGQCYFYEQPDWGMSDLKQYQDVYNALVAGQEAILVWAYNAQTGTVDFYAGLTPETVVKTGSLWTGKPFPLNGTVTRVGFCDPWPNSVKSNIDVTLAYGDSLAKALGIYEDIIVDTTGVQEGGSVSVTEGAKRGDDVTVTVSYDAATLVLKTFTINGENYLERLENNRVILPGYLKANLVITAEFMEKTSYNVTVSADSKWGADGLVITFAKDGVTKTATLGDASASVIPDMDGGIWDASTVISGLKVSLGKVSIASAECVIDFTNTFGGAIVGGQLNSGKFIYATGNQKTVDFDLNAPQQGSMYFATKVKFDSTAVASTLWTNLAMRLEVNGKTIAPTMMYTASTANDGWDYEKMYVWQSDTSGWVATPHFPDDINNALRDGVEVLFVWAYNAETGALDIYAGLTPESVRLICTCYSAALAQNGTVTKFGFGDPWSGGAKSNIEVTFSYGTTLNEALGIAEAPQA